MVLNQNPLLYLFVGMLMKLNPPKKSMKVKKSQLAAEEEAATIHTRTNMVEKRNLLIETECSSAISLMI